VSIPAIAHGGGAGKQQVLDLMNGVKCGCSNDILLISLSFYKRK
jgi:hypothetical protein